MISMGRLGAVPSMSDRDFDALRGMDAEDQRRIDDAYANRRLSTATAVA